MNDSDTSQPQSDLLLRSILDTMQDAVISVSLVDRKQIYVSKSFEQVIGYPAQPFLDDPDYFKQIIHPDDSHLALEARQTIFQQGFVEFDHRVILPDGQIRWLHRRIWMVYDDQHHPINVNDSARDITTQKLAQEALIESEETNRLVLSSISDAVFVTDDAGTFTFICPNVDVLFGYSQSEVSALGNITRLLGDNLFDSEQLAHEGEITNIERLIYDAEGQPHYVLISVKHITLRHGTTLYTCRDISERKQGEIALQAAYDLLEQRVVERTVELERTRDRLEAIFQHSGDGILLLDRQQGIQQANYAFEELSGVTQPHYIGMDLGTFIRVPNHNLDRVMNAAAETHRVHHIEGQVYRGNGETLDIEISIAPVNRSHKAVMNLVCIIRDITARKTAQAALEAKHQQELQMQHYLKTLHSIMVDLIHTDTLDDFYRMVVKDGLTRFGFERMGLLLYDPENGSAVGTYGTDANGNLVSEYHLRLDPGSLTGILKRTLDHSELFAFDEDAELFTDLKSMGRGQNAVAALWDGKALGWLTIDNGIQHQPITQMQLEILVLYALTTGSLLARKVAEQQAKSLSERLELATKAGSIGIWDWNWQTKTLVWDEYMFALYGAVPDETVDPYNIWQQAVHPDHAHRLQTEIESAIEQHHPYDSEFRVVLPDGRIRHIKVNANILYRSDGMAERIVGVNMDISHLKAAEQTLRLALEKEKELNDLKSRFVSMASHEFRTPLATILATTETLIAYRDRMDSGKIDDRLNKIRQQVTHMKSITEDMLQLTRIQAGRIDYQLGLGDLDAFCREIIEEFDSQVQHQGRIHYTSQQPAAWMNYDTHLMRQIINNLISNALKYSAGGVPVTVELTFDDTQIFLKVSDHGIGIPADDLDHMFEPFRRASNVGTISGTGLGLSITKQAVEIHGGKITLESQVGVGTSFMLVFPKVSAKNKNNG